MTILNKGAYRERLLPDDRHNPGSVDARHARAYEDPVGDLNRLAARHHNETGEQIPRWDPDSGGVRAQVLLLLQDPSEVAATGSRMISRHNNDRTAANTFDVCERAGLDDADSVHWNVISWWAQDPARTVGGSPRSLAREAKRAQPYLVETLAVLTELRCIVLLGQQAKTAWP